MLTSIHPHLTWPRSLVLLAGLFCMYTAASAQSAQEIRAAIAPKLDAKLKMELDALLAPGPFMTGDSVPLIPVFVKGGPAAAAAIERAGGSVGSRLDGIMTAEIPRSKIVSIALDPSVERIEAAGILVRCDDSLRRAIGSDLVRGGMPPLTRGYTGKGVIVGIVDLGFDIDHREFRDRFDTSRSRILSIWSQPIETGSNPEGFNYGTEWTADVIQQEIDAPAGIIPRPEFSGDSHGTHVAGIAAGIGGVAPDADIIVVQVAAYFSAQPPFATRVVDATRYIFEKAAKLGRPCVVNISLGDEINPHDGSDLMSQALDQLVAAGSGRIICAAVGNSGDQKNHWGGFAAEPDSIWTYAYNRDCYLRVPDSALSTFEFSIVVDSGFSVEAPFVAQTAWRSVAAIRNAPGALSDSIHDRDGKVFELITMSAAPLGGDHTELMISFPYRRVNRCRVNVRGSGWFHMWSDGLVTPGTISALSWETNDRFREPDSLYDISRPAIARNVIAVGASVNRASYVDGEGNTQTNFPPGIPGALAEFSSRGPAVDGRVKPDIVAPGDIVISARSRHEPDIDPIDVWGEDTTMMVMSGTSMACPAVAGAIALYLEKNPRADFNEVRTAIVAAARRDALTASHGPLPNGHWGNGKLDIFAALTGVASHVGTSSRGPDAMPAIHANHRGEAVLHLALKSSEEVDIVIADLTGTDVLRAALGRFGAGTHSVPLDLHALPQGAYLYRIALGASTTTGALLIVR
jgi:minor extracellular serine protease Vpr